MSNGHTLPLPVSESIPTAALPSEELDTTASAPPIEESQLDQSLRDLLGEEYEIGGEIGRGGMGIVYRAMDRKLRREVAIKILPPDMAHRSDLRKRFIREAQLAASLTHPHIVPIYDVGQRNGLTYMVMAFISGESVRDLIRRSGPQPSHVVGRIMREVAWALSYAHARGVIHRDIKPDNIMVERVSGRTIVMDFGLAKINSLEEEDEHLTQPGKVLGTPAYMSPEQARGKEGLDHRTDIYSLGVVGYHMLTGRNPFDATNAQAIMARVLTEDPPEIGTVRPDVPSWLAEPIAKAMQRQPAKRYEHAEELAEALDRAQTSRDIPTSVQMLLDLAEAYVELSVLGAWLLWIMGMPDLPQAGAVIIAAFLAVPVLSVMQLLTAEGLGWPDIREGIIARRMHWLKTLSLKREVGVHLPSVLLVVVTILGVAVVRWIGPLLWLWNYGFSSGKFVEMDDMGPAGTGYFLFQGPQWALVYALVGSLMWARLFGLPLGRRISPQKLDAIASWQVPGWLDRLGSILFKGMGSTSRIIEATSDFRQLAEPAVREAVAFIRMKRILKWKDRWALRCPLHLGRLTVRRVWWMHERMLKLREKHKRAKSDRQSEKLYQAIEKRETILAECAAVLSSLRIMMDERRANSREEDEEGVDETVIAELRRLTCFQRRLKVAQIVFMGLWCITLVTNFAWIPAPSILHEILSAVLVYSLLLFIGFQFVKRRLYS